MKQLFTFMILLAISCNTNQKIPYQQATGYFVKNSFDGQYNSIITNQSEFEKIFGTAAVMGPGGLPTTIDFSKEYVIAMIEGETDVATIINILNLKKSGGEIILEYSVIQGEKQTFTIRPMVLLVVNNDYIGALKKVKK